MPQGFAARIGDPVSHPLPPVLGPGPGSFNVWIGNKPAWRGMPLAAVGALSAAKQASDTAIQTAEAATLAAPDPVSKAAAKTAEETLKATTAVVMGSAVMAASGGADIHTCTTLLPIPPHGPGVVINGSPTVLINNLPACRQGDQILEALGPPNVISMGHPTVIIGDKGSGAQGQTLQNAAQVGAATVECGCK
jgi:uncharacterized Zn-binding protein involved in type VI secretion